MTEDKPTPEPTSPPDADFDVEARLKTLPEEPGVYIMKNRQGKIVYIGKSINLRSRVRSYFNGHDPRPFVARLPKLLGEIETIITANEKEALILENTLIKAHKPRYNVMLRDDKNYLSLRIDPRKAWPRVEITRGIKRDGARYFGPYHSASSLRRALNVLNKHFMLRTCPDSVLQNRSRPCLQYQIKRCPGPCVFEVDQAKYEGHVRDAILFLEGRTEQLAEQLQARMDAAAEALEFELAAHFRDQLSAVQTSLESQQVVSIQLIDQDVVGLHREADRVTIQLLYIRRGKLEGSEAFHFKGQEFGDEEVLSSFLNQYYASGAALPHEVILPLPLEATDALEQVLSELRGAKVTLHHPQRGKKLALLESALRNAESSFRQRNPEGEREADLLSRLKAALKLTNTPSRVECFDISNFQGDPIVGSMSVFLDGKPANREYRHFRVKEVTQQDDFASMYEVLTRRFLRSQQDDWPMPDLVVIDGGKGQLSQALAVLNDLGIHEVDVISLAKSRVESNPQSEVIERSMERVFLPGRKNPVVLRQNSPELFLLTRIRDEAHRFAITYHRKLRRKKTLHSTLDDIPGVGPARRKALMEHFGGIDGVRDASVADLEAVAGISEAIARQIFAFFNGELALEEGAKDWAEVGEEGGEDEDEGEVVGSGGEG